MFGMTPDVATSKQILIDFYAPNFELLNIFGNAAPV